MSRLVRRSLTALPIMILLGSASSDPSVKEDSIDDVTEEDSMDAAALEQLRSLGYVASAQIEPSTKDLVGTTRHERDRAHPGYNLVSLMGGDGPGAYLYDMAGRVVHTWESKAGQPKTPLERTLPFLSGWQYCRMLPGGELLVLVGRAYLVKLDWNSQVLWKTPLAVHHDVSVGSDGRIYALAEEFRYVGKARRLILDSVLTVLTPEGELEQAISLHDVLEADEGHRALLQQKLQQSFGGLGQASLTSVVRRQTRKSGGFWTEGRLDALEALEDSSTVEGYSFRELFTLVRKVPATPSDVFHANTLAPVPAHESGLWSDDDLLVSVRNLDLVGVIDRRTQKLTWSWGPGVLRRQHQPSMLANQNILIFDNGRKRSRVLEVDPTTNQVTWSFDGGDEPFFTPGGGGVQRLPNGNTLITITRSGRVIEVTRAGEIVWEFLVPFRDASLTTSGKTERYTAYRVTRLERDVVEPLLDASVGAGPEK